MASSANISVQSTSSGGLDFIVFPSQTCGYSFRVKVLVEGVEILAQHFFPAPTNLTAYMYELPTLADNQGTYNITLLPSFSRKIAVSQLGFVWSPVSSRNSSTIVPVTTNSSSWSSSSSVSLSSTWGLTASINSSHKITHYSKALRIGLGISLPLLFICATLLWIFCLRKSRSPTFTRRTWFIEEPTQGDEDDRGRRSLEIPTPFIDRVITPTPPSAKGVSSRDQLLNLRTGTTETQRQMDGAEIQDPPRSALTSSDAPPSYSTWGDVLAAE
ncbi:hypothetical protein CPB83DRAFT_831265 [Crepidotus variabilis]|uniref:Uncharacterized protein n=1 Tax=Crepidotus variabilis TaxID=179855 RepID=A0A9P6JWJ6_9AGAR|nr:hypothetical protein CPB83DRAFT_831265 [Crepidotus variabilis]